MEVNAHVNAICVLSYLPINSTNICLSVSWHLACVFFGVPGKRCIKFDAIWFNNNKTVINSPPVSVAVTGTRQCDKSQSVVRVEHVFFYILGLITAVGGN